MLLSFFRIRLLLGALTAIDQLSYDSNGFWAFALVVNHVLDYYARPYFFNILSKNLRRSERCWTQSVEERFLFLSINFLEKI